MTLNILTEVTDALRDSRTDELAPVVTEITSAAEQAGISVLPATLDIDATIVLDHTQLHVRDVLSAAVASGAALLYLNHEVVNPADMSSAIQQADLPSEGETTRRAALRGLSRIAGWTAEVELGFVDHGVMVVWTVTTDWADQLHELTRQLRQRTLPTDQWTSNEDDEPTTSRLDDATITALATQLTAIMEFRRARLLSERTSAAQRVPELAHLSEQPDSQWQIHNVIRTATELLQEQVAGCLEQLKPRHAELATTLAADPNFRAVRTADARQKFTEEWLFDHSDGYRLPTWWIKELVAEARNRPNQLTL